VIFSGDATCTPSWGLFGSLAAASLRRFTATGRARPGLRVGSTLDGGPNWADDARCFLVACEVDRGVVITLVSDRTAAALPAFGPIDVLHMPAGMAFTGLLDKIHLSTRDAFYSLSGGGSTLYTKQTSASWP
jgi:hypothetical protein